MSSSRKTTLTTLRNYFPLVVASIVHFAYFHHELSTPSAHGLLDHHPYSPQDIYESILKSKDITLPTKVHLVKAVVFPIVMYGCDSWTVKKN